MKKFFSIILTVVLFLSTDIGGIVSARQSRDATAEALSIGTPILNEPDDELSDEIMDILPLEDSQTQGETDLEAEAEAEAAVADPNVPISPIDSSVQLIAPLGAYIHEEAFAQEYSMAALFSDCYFYFNVGDWKIEDAVLTLVYSTLMPLDNTISSITFSVNGKYFKAIRPIDNSGEKTQIKLRIPKELLISGVNSLKIESYLRTVDSLPCVDDVSSVNRMNFYKNSAVSISYSPAAKADTISSFHKQFYSIDALEYGQSVVAFPPNAENSVLSAASQILAGMASFAVLYPEEIAFLGAEPSQISRYKYIIYVCKSDEIPAGYAELLTSVQKEQVASQGLLALLNYGDQKVLLASAPTAEDIDIVAKLLMNQDLSSQLLSNSRIVSQSSDVYTREGRDTQYRFLTETGNMVVGAFERSAEYFIDMPQNRKLSYASEVYLSFRYSKNLDFLRSLVTVRINGTPIGSKRLTEEAADNDELRIQIPTDLDVAGNFTVSIVFNLMLQDQWCTLRLEETPWGYVTPKSTLKLNTMERDDLLFEAFPSPFVRDGSFYNATIIMPDKPTKSDYHALGTLLKTMGQSIAFNQGSFDIKSGSDTGDLSKRNIIAIGAFSQNEYIKSLNKRLFFKFSDDGKRIISNEKRVISPSYGETLGTGQLLYSPHGNKQNALLVISGPDEAATLRASDCLKSPGEIWQVAGDGFLVDREQTFPYRFKLSSEQSEILIGEISEREDVQIFIIIGGLVVLLLFVSLMLIFIKYRKRRKEQ